VRRPVTKPVPINVPVLDEHADSDEEEDSDPDTDTDQDPGSANSWGSSIPEPDQTRNRHDSIVSRSCRRIPKNSARIHSISRRNRRGGEIDCWYRNWEESSEESPSTRGVYAELAEGLAQGRISSPEILVRKEGFEPPRPFGHKILSLARLPVPPLPQWWLYSTSLRRAALLGF
jgi:hypothetical protein